MQVPLLDEVVHDALTLLARGVPAFPDIPFKHPLVIGSVNAHEVGKILFRDTAAYPASESDYLRVLERYQPDGAVLISASGSKHATGIAETLTALGLRTLLLTHTPNSPASVVLRTEDVHVFPKQDEPYTYNTSTYFGLVASRDQSDVSEVVNFVTSVRQSLPDLTARAYTCVLPSAYALAVPMVRTKFEELFGNTLPAKVFNDEELKHAKTVVPAEGECYIFFGDADDRIVYDGVRKVRVPLMPQNYLAALAVAYTTVGVIQKSQPALFQEYLDRYMEKASAVFNTTLTPLVQ
jgi:hypothetical protein